MTHIDANPYPWPWDGALSTRRLAVVIAGAQRYWSARTVGSHGELATACGLASRVRPLGVPVIWVRHGQPRGGRNSVPVVGSEEWALAAPPEAGDVVIDAAGHDGCYGSCLDATLRSLRRDQIVLCGLGLEGPVHSTLRSLNDRGYECLTLTDACAPYELASGPAALSTITFSFGIFGAIAPTAALLAALPTEAIAP